MFPWIREWGGGGVWLDEQKRKKVIGYKVIVIHNVNEK